MTDIGLWAGPKSDCAPPQTPAGDTEASSGEVGSGRTVEGPTYPLGACNIICSIARTTSGYWWVPASLKQGHPRPVIRQCRAWL